MAGSIFRALQKAGYLKPVVDNLNELIQRKRYEKDHFIPVTEGGRFEAGNVVPACERCNKRKHNRRPEVFLEGKPDVLERILTYLTAYLTNAKL